MSDYIPHPAGAELGRKSLGPTTTIQNKYIEHGAHCAHMPEGTDGCFTGDGASGVRGRLIIAYEQNVLAAQMQFGDALTEIHLEALLEKPEDLPIFITLAFEGLIMLADTALGKALAMLRRAPASTLTALDIMAGEVDKQNEFMEIVRASDPSALVGMGIATGKKAAMGAMTAKNADAQATVDFAGQISDASAVAFERQRQDPPGYASDAELVALFHAWSAASGHTKNQYKTMLAGIISRFKASGASKVGRQFMKDAHQNNVVRDTQLVAIMPQDDEGAPQMWLYKRDYDKAWFTDEDMANPQSDRHDDQARDESFVKWKLVEPEFLDQAMLANQAAWGVPYETRYDVTDYMKLTRTH